MEMFSNTTCWTQMKDNLRIFDAFQFPEKCKNIFFFKKDKLKTKFPLDLHFKDCQFRGIVVSGNSDFKELT